MAPMIYAADVTPDFSTRPRLTAEHLRHLAEPCVLYEYDRLDSDGNRHFVYTVGGYLQGIRLADGATVGGDVIVIHADDRAEADAMAVQGLADTINALDAEEDQYQEAHAALARLASVSPTERIDQALKPASDKSDAFVEDVKAVRPLIGDDIVMTTATNDTPTKH